MMLMAFYVLLFAFFDTSYVPPLHAHNDPYTVAYPIHTPSEQEFHVTRSTARSSQRARQIRNNNLDLQVTRLFELDYVPQLLPDAFQSYVSSYSHSELFEKHHLYAHDRFLAYIRNLDGYDNYVLQLHSKMRKNRSLKYIPGFVGDF